MSLLPLRVGIGHDTHRLKIGGPLRLGGLEIPFDFSLDGHSDADVLLHAVTDALLGAAGLGDIGEWFPDTDSAFAGADSADLLAQVYQHILQQHCQIINLDCIVFAQRPKLSPYKVKLAQRIAEILTISPSQVSVKAKTGEGIGEVGEMRVMQAQCVVLLQVTDPANLDLR